MFNKPKLYHIFLFLLLWGIMPSASCLGCKNLDTDQGKNDFTKGKDDPTKGNNDSNNDNNNNNNNNNNDAVNKPSLYVKEFMKNLADGQLKTSGVITALQEKKIVPLDKDEYGRNMIQNIIYGGTTPKDLEAILQACKQQFPNQEQANQEITKMLNTPDDTENRDTAFINAVCKIAKQRDANSMELIDVLFQHGARPSPKELEKGLWHCVESISGETSETHIGFDLFKNIAAKFKENNLPICQATAIVVASLAARNRDGDLMKYVLETPASFPIDAYSKDKEGNTFLHHAAAGDKNNTNVIDLLLEKFNSPKVDYINQVNKKGESALHVAVRHSSVNAVGALIKTGANIHLKTQDGKTPLDIANDLIANQPPNNTLIAIKKKLLNAIQGKP